MDLAATRAKYVGRVVRMDSDPDIIGICTGVTTFGEWSRYREMYTPEQNAKLIILVQLKRPNYGRPRAEYISDEPDESGRRFTWSIYEE